MARKRWFRASVLALTLLVSSASAETETNDLGAIYGRTLQEIVLEGNTRTRDIVILREIEFAVGDLLERDAIVESRKRLNNLRIFTNVDFIFEAAGANQARLTIKVEERWTAIPIARFGSAGGTNFFALGAFDINFLGKYWELGAQYENLNKRSGGVTWFRNPRLFNQRLLVGYDLWFTAKNRELYDGDGDEVSAFTFGKTRIHAFLQKELNRSLVLGTGLDYTRHNVSDDSLSSRQRRRNRRAGFALPPDSKQLAFEATARVGRLNFDSYLVEGFQSDWEFRLARKELGSSENSNQITIQNRAFFILPREHNVGLNLSFGHTDTPLLPEQFFIGGLNEVRGYLDGQFVGVAHWRANVEYRAPSYQSKWVVLQHVAFVDIGNAGSSFAGAFENETYNSVGLGLRIISPKVFRLNVRIDYARTFGRTSGGAFSFGLQQFF